MHIFTSLKKCYLLKYSDFSSEVNLIPMLTYSYIRYQNI